MTINPENENNKDRNERKDSQSAARHQEGPETPGNSDTMTWAENYLEKVEKTIKEGKGDATNKQQGATLEKLKLATGIYVYPKHDGEGNHNKKHLAPDGPLNDGFDDLMDQALETPEHALNAPEAMGAHSEPVGDGEINWIKKHEEYYDRLKQEKLNNGAMNETRIDDQAGGRTEQTITPALAKQQQIEENQTMARLEGANKTGDKNPESGNPL